MPEQNNNTYDENVNTSDIHNLLNYIWKYFSTNDGDTLVLRKSLIDICNGSHTTALLISQLLYWHNKYGDMNRWMKIEVHEWYEQIRLTERKLKTARQKALNLNIIETKYKRFDGKRCLHLRIKFHNLTNMLIEYDKTRTSTEVQDKSSEKDPDLSTARSGRNVRTGADETSGPITKTTTQITKDNNKEKKMNEKKLSHKHQETFDKFWDAYPRKKAKKKAFEIWKRKQLWAIADEIIEKVNKQNENEKSWKEGYIPNPTTYLNQERWHDDITPHTTVYKQTDVTDQYFESLNEMKREYINGQRYIVQPQKLIETDVESSPKNGTAKQPQCRDTEPESSVTQGHQKNNSQECTLSAQSETAYCESYTRYPQGGSSHRKRGGLPTGRHK